MEGYRLDPWASAIRLEYEKLFRYFGIKPFQPLLPEVEKAFGKPHRLMRRGIIFGHRDYEKILEAYRSGERIALVTGFMPSGKFHFGHKMVADQIIYYQKLGFEIFVVIADAEAYAVRRLDRRKIIEIGLYEYVANLIALGLEKNKHTHIYFQTNYETPYYRLIQMFSRRVTLEEMSAIYGDLEPSKIMAALTQAADILHPQLDYFGGFKYVVVPVGADQDPHIRLTRDIAARFENELGLRRPASTYHRFQTGLDGNKMSSSRPEYTIFLTDPVDIAVRKLKRALTGGRATVEEQRRLGGEPEKCTVYEFYLYHLIEDDTQLRKIYEDCRGSRLLCGPDKEYAAELLAKFLEEHQRRLERARDRVLEYVEPPKF
ncbi:tryptophan--tRNA ligase [Hyperthermus butylicus]|uniref:Tryptophan--tRNA ligase n=1 Tax=Hyperthermus butylicus (strain DSM 5456 / JCM 9403 / PLM1-5) TaxID=415426 RepID=SYW_HYPBU|nr:tryptophan--tRNA ligase [Hyperthermus butylicus]A2BLD4.1 RecName: Full=Tryptophan--tRNA ligase; AltName: Full=Tryptophanyl-tRNA synthetase; Short=TrpRS [Hyperthermus butylicus DSM 5456]ABM80795.1 Tryptophanyl-tRNA synthetase [Hyperthermus butylicus DSM 5456]